MSLKQRWKNDKILPRVVKKNPTKHANVKVRNK